MNQNIKTEQAVLASMIIDDRCSVEHGLISEEDFTQEIHKVIYTAIKNLSKKEKNIDYLEIHNETNKRVAIDYLMNLSDNLPSTANFKQYVDVLKDLTLKRKIFKITNDIRNSEKTGKELAEIAESEIFKLREETNTSEFTNLNEIILDVYDDMALTYEDKKERGLSTGYPAIDRVLGGMRKQEYILLAARPSIGKTALAINVAENLLAKNKSIAFFSYEMSKNQLVERLLKGLALVDSKRINKERIPGSKKNYEMNPKDWRKISSAANYLSKKNLSIDDDPNKTVPEMLSMCRKLKREKGLDLVIIDYLQKVKTNEKGTKREKLEYVSNEVKNMAKALDVPVIAISSLSRKNEERNVKIPQLSDLRESGQLEFDADVIMFLHRDYYYDRTETHKKHDADLVIAKNRNFKVGAVKLLWFEEYTKFMSVRDGRELTRE